MFVKSPLCVQNLLPNLDTYVVLHALWQYGCPSMAHRQHRQVIRQFLLDTHIELYPGIGPEVNLQRVSEYHQNHELLLAFSAK